MKDRSLGNSTLGGKLIELGLREEYDKPITLHSGLRSRIKWDIEKLFAYPQWVRLKAIEEFVWEVGKLNPKQIIGIRTGGFDLACDLCYPHTLNIRLTDDKSLVYEIPCVLLDDVLTTGDTVGKVLNRIRQYQPLCLPNYIAILVNRSRMTEIEGIPIISGIQADLVE